MRKINKILIISLIIVLTISLLSCSTFADDSNITNSNGKGNISAGDGTKESPYEIELGSPIIDIYYNPLIDEGAEGDNDIYFKFTSGAVNSANYLVDRNIDKHRLRLTLVGTAENDLRVTSQSGASYLQAGAYNYYIEGIEAGDTKIDVQTPYYTIEEIDEVMADRTTKTGGLIGEVFDKIVEGLGGDNTTPESLKHIVELGNGYLNSDLISNISTYSTSYVFAKSGLNVEEIYVSWNNLAQNGIKINFSSSLCTLLSNYQMTYTAHAEGMEFQYLYDISNKPVDIVYCFKGTNSQIMDSSANEAKPLESLISKLLTSFGDAFVERMGIAKFENDQYKSYVTFDGLVFGEYAPTIVDFWDNTGSTNGIAKDVVNYWYKVFKALAILAYIILLIYVGIRVVISAGTPSQSKVKAMLEGWVIGILLMAFLPFSFKYILQINNVIVDILRANSKYSVYAYYSFEDMYREYFDQKEDGEDSTTDVLTKLLNARKYLNEKYEESIELMDKADNNTTKSEEKVKEYEENYENFYSSATDGFNTVLGWFTEGTNPVREMHYDIIKIDNGGYGDPRITSEGEIYEDIMNLLEKYYDENSFYYDGSDTANIQEGNRIFKDGLEEKVDEFLKEYQIGYIERDDDGNPLYYDDGTLVWNAAFYDINENGNTDNQLKLFRDEMKKVIMGGYSVAGDGQHFDGFNDVYEAKEGLQYWQAVYEAAEKESEQTLIDLSAVEKAIEMVENNNADIMGMLRKRAGDTYRFIYVILWLILIFELVLLLVVYYKRLFILAALVMIFPLVTVMYVFEKAQGGKPKALLNWVEEFLINIFLQTGHAILYVTLVESGYSIYMNNNENVVLFIFAITAMITSEAVIKQILGINGKTVKNLGEYGKQAAGYGAAGLHFMGTALSTAKDLKNIDKKSKNEEASTNKKEKENDKRLSTVRRYRDNKINNSSLSKEDKDKIINSRNEKREKFDKVKDKARKTAAKYRRLRMRGQQAKRIANTFVAGATAIGAGLAAGGDAENFGTALGVAKSTMGLDGKEVKLSEDAEKMEKENAKEKEEAKKNADNGQVTGVTVGESQETQNVNPFNGTLDENGIPLEATDNATEKKTSKLMGAFLTAIGGEARSNADAAQALDDEKISIKNNINIHDNDKK